MLQESRNDVQDQPAVNAAAAAAPPAVLPTGATSAMMTGAMDATAVGGDASGYRHHRATAAPATAIGAYDNDQDVRRADEQRAAERVIDTTQVSVVLVVHADGLLLRQ